MSRSAPRTLVVALGVLWALGAPTARSEGEGGARPSADRVADLRTAGRADAPAAVRREAASRLVATGLAKEDADAGVRAAALLLGDDPPLAAALLRAAFDANLPSADTRALAADLGRARHADEADPARRAGLACFLLALGERAPFAAAIGERPDAPGVREAAAADGFSPPADAATTGPAWTAHTRVADLLDRATEDDPSIARRAVEALLAKDLPDPVPLLLAAAARQATRTPPGRVPRRVRAIVVLGLLGDRRAVEVLLPCLDDLTNDGWVRQAAAAALGDLGDARAVAPLCRVLFYLGDLHRLHDSWDYPGVDNTPVPPERWDRVEYQAVDVAAADALLRLGVRGAAEWLIRERLHPRSGRWRVRVHQDACDALRRAFPGAPTGYEPDAGVPARAAATAALLAWWRTGPSLAAPLAADAPGFADAARSIAATIGGRSVMELHIAKRSATLLGPPMREALLDALRASTNRVQRSELVTVLGSLGDRGAVEPLLAATSDPVPTVRANAIAALWPYVGAEDDPRLVGVAAGATDRIVARAIEMLDDPEAAPRTAALQTLACAPPRAEIRAAVAARASAVRPENAFDDYRVAEEVVALVQEGAPAKVVLARLADPVQHLRRAVFDLLRRAFDLEPDLFDPTIAPGTAAWRPLDAARLEAAVARRRGVR